MRDEPRHSSTNESGPDCTGTHLGWQSGRPPGVSAQFPFLPDNLLLLAGRSCPTKEDLPHPGYDPQTVAQPLGSLEDKTLYGLILLLPLSGVAAARQD